MKCKECRETTERRRKSSRFYRFIVHPAVHRIAAALVIAGWSLVLFGATLDPEHDVVTHIDFVLWLGGALLVFVGCTAGFVSWVLNPAIDRRFAQHILKGAEEHRDLLGIAEYNRRHEVIIGKLSRIEGALGVKDALPEKGV